MITEHAAKGPLCDLITRHVDFDYDAFIARTPIEGYDHWNGYCLPFEYSNARDEYHAIRNSCGLFDASPMKKYRFRGADAGAFLDRILTNSVSDKPRLKAIYGLMCDEGGYLLDDGMLFKLADDDYLFLITEIDHFEWFAKFDDFEDLQITEESALLHGLALQGPQSCALLSAFGFADLAELKPFDLKVFELDGFEIITGRVGFTGDLGYEIWFPTDALPAMEAALNEAEQKTGIKGLGYGLITAQIGRIEAGMIVPGWDTSGTFEDLEHERTPLELTLSWNVKLKREDAFAGKAALIRQKADGPRFVMKGVRLDDPAEIEEGADLFTLIDGERIKVGTIPSLIWHVQDECWLGFASLQAAHKSVENVFALSGETQVNADLSKLPFVQFERRAQTPAPV